MNAYHTIMIEYYGQKCRIYVSEGLIATTNCRTFKLKYLLDITLLTIIIYYIHAYIHVNVDIINSLNK